MERKSLSVEGKIISYKIAGSGKPVILLHGFGVDSSIWDEQLYFLSKNYLVIAPDLPGVSTSDLISDTSMEGIAAIVKKIAAEEELDMLILIGHSMGGYATLAFAEMYPEALLGFGLFHSTAVADNDDKIITRRKGIEFVQKHGVTAFLEATSLKMFGNTTKNKHKNLIDHFFNHLPEMSKEAAIDYYEAMIQRPDRTSILKNAKVPVMFVYGNEDEIVDLEKNIGQASLPSVSSVYIMKHAGHLSMLELPLEASTTLDDFLSTI